MLTFPITLFSGVPATVTNTANVDASAGSVHVSPGVDTYTFNGVALGTALGTSLVVVLADIWSNGTNPAINAISIDGSAGTLLQSAMATNSSTFDAGIAIASRATSNTSGTIVLTSANGSIRSRISVFRLNSLISATANDSQKASNITPANASVNLNVPADGIVVAGGATLNPPDATAPTLTGITQAANGNLGGATNLYKWVYGDVQGQGANASLTITSVLNAGAVAGNAIVAASWH